MTLKKPQKINFQNESKIFVGGIPRLTGLQEFLDYFKKFGEICEYQFLMKKFNNFENLGFGFINFKRCEDVKKVFNSTAPHLIRAKVVILQA